MPTSEPVALRAAAQRAVRGALLERLPMKAIALFFAFVLWLAVSADEPGEQTVPVRLVLRVDGRAAVRAGRPLVSATITGRRRDLVKLGAGPLVLRRTIAPGAADSVRLVVRPSDVELPPGLERELRVREVRPRVLTLHFARTSAAAATAGVAAATASVIAAPVPRTPASPAEDEDASDDSARADSVAVAADSGATDTLFLSGPRPAARPPRDTGAAP